MFCEKGIPKLQFGKYHCYKLPHVFDEPKNVIRVTNKIKDILKTLDIENKQLINHALSSGMNSFSAIEVFPRNDRGVRLPMGKGYTVITDHILTNVPLVINKGTRLVADFVSLIDWLEDPNRKYMDKDAVINFIADKMSLEEDENKKKEEK